MKEIWKTIPGYYSRYQVSNLGNVRRLSYDITSKTGKHIHRDVKYLKKFINNSGYLAVYLLNPETKHRDYKTVHRLVASTFLSNPDNLPIVNHKNEDKKDNRVCNLEWCTQSDNMKHNNINKRIGDTLRGKKANNRIPVYCITKDTVYESMSYVCNYLNIPWYQLKHMLEDINYNYKGYKFRYID